MPGGKRGWILSKTMPFSQGWGAAYTHLPLTNLTRVQSGLGRRNFFSSEGGTVVMSSFESMARLAVIPRPALCGAHS